MKKMLSIIVPIYKIEKFLSQCIDSILAQTYIDFELILVDDGSPDNCPRICDEYEKKDKRIKVVHKENGGLVSARKAGLQVAKGDYIGYVDGDDWIEPDFYKHLIDVAVENDADMVASGFIKDIGDNCSLKNNTLSCGCYSKEEIATVILPKMMFDDDSFEPGLFTYVWNKIFKKSLLYPAQMNVPDSVSLGEDAACVYPAVLNAECLCITNDCLYHYRQRADSMLKNSESYSEDYCGYRQLYSYLRKYFINYYYLHDELDKFVLYLITTRCGGVYFKNNSHDWYLFDRAPSGNSIAVYGAGTLGQHLVRRLIAYGKYEIVKWVDEDYEILRHHGLFVDAPDSIFFEDYDNVIIAFLNKNTADKIKNQLICNGVSEEKIIVSDFLNIDAQSVFRKIGIIQDGLE